MLDKWKRSVYKTFGAILTDLSKAFDYLDHELQLQIAKLNTYRFSLPAFRLIQDYLSHGLMIHMVNGLL